MANKLTGGWEPFGDTLKVFAIIPLRANGELNIGAFNATMLALTRINPAAFDPTPIPAEQIAHADGITATGSGIIPSGIAEAMLRDKVLIDPEREDDTGEPYPDPRYAGTTCNIGGRCDE